LFEELVSLQITSRVLPLMEDGISWWFFRIRPGKIRNRVYVNFSASLGRLPHSHGIVVYLYWLGIPWIPPLLSPPLILVGILLQNPRYCLGKNEQHICVLHVQWRVCLAEVWLTTENSRDINLIASTLPAIIFSSLRLFKVNSFS
jgi:hypothetical protein